MRATAATRGTGKKRGKGEYMEESQREKERERGREDKERINVQSDNPRDLLQQETPPWIILPIRESMKCIL